ncbi:type II toxin-antitoxin system HicA family toxin [Candidatus Magnetominusculus xianensis]|uniref:type II toxin-antitoxin system HicA family toxin n=1 Tax=Candidatus Magnetominusculus xianensis TaxID=1748249 RepID=UPI000A10E4FA|nr:type II toxin-antitoxin system HicA family toxin [Nitrospirota bacterium]
MKLPCISGRQCVKALEKIGFHEVRQRGSHIVLCRDNPYAQVIVPNHDTLDRGTLRAIIRHSNLTVAEFIELL